MREKIFPQTIKPLHKLREEEKALRKYFANNTHVSKMQLKQKQFSTAHCQGKRKDRSSNMCYAESDLINYVISFNTQNCTVTSVWVSTGNVR